MPIISVIVPVYNVAQFLPRCVDSILAQSFRDFEVILVDDGSTDESGALCEQYTKTDSRIRVIHQENRGLSGARNTGIEHAEGTYLAFVDSDDFVPGYMLRDLLDTAEQSGADFVKGNYLPFRREDECQCSSDKAVTILDTRAALSEHFSPKKGYEKKVSTTVWNGLYRRELFDSIRFPEGLLYEDGYVTPQLILASQKIAHINEVVYYYYQNNGGIIASGLSAHALKSLDDKIFVHELIKKRYPEFNQITCQAWIDKYIHVYCQIRENKQADPDHLYRRKIRLGLLRNLRYFSQCGIRLKTLVHIVLFCLFPFISKSR